MRTLLAGIVSLGMMVGVPAAQARDTVHQLKINEVLQDPQFAEKVGNDVKFYFGGQKQPAVSQSLGSYVTNKKTNALNKSDEEACRWVMLSALLELKQRAKSLNADAVTNIVSYYKKNEFSSDTLYECHAGALMAGVALKGTMVKLKR